MNIKIYKQAHRLKVLNDALNYARDKRKGLEYTKGILEHIFGSERIQINFRGATWSEQWLSQKLNEFREQVIYAS